MIRLPHFFAFIVQLALVMKENAEQNNSSPGVFFTIHGNDAFVLAAVRTTYIVDRIDFAIANYDIFPNLHLWSFFSANLLNCLNEISCINALVFFSFSSLLFSPFSFVFGTIAKTPRHLLPLPADPVVRFP